MFPIHAITHWEDDGWKCNLKSVAFVHLFARLAIKYIMYGSFQDKDRVGLLTPNHAGDNILQYLVNSLHHSGRTDLFVQWDYNIPPY